MISYPENEIASKMVELIKKINHHRNLYYNQDNPEISDEEYNRV